MIDNSCLLINYGLFCGHWLWLMRITKVSLKRLKYVIALWNWPKNNAIRNPLKGSAAKCRSTRVPGPVTLSELNPA